MKLRFFGTGTAMVKQHLHTAFLVETAETRLLVDTLGGYDIVRALRSRGMRAGDVPAVFVSHRHIDHALGFLWLVRIIAQDARDGLLPEGYGLRVLCSPALRGTLTGALESFIPDYYAIAKPYLEFIELADGTPVELSPGNMLTPVDLQSTKAEQFGFVLEAEGKAFAFTGDERVAPERFERTRGCDLLLSQASCLDADEPRYQAHAKHQATVREAAEAAAALGAKALAISHTADEAPDRRKRYVEEASRFFSGRIEVPEDGETIEI